MRRRTLTAFLAALVVIAFAAPSALAQSGDAGSGGDPTLDGGGTDEVVPVVVEFEVAVPRSMPAGW